MNFTICIAASGCYGFYAETVNTFDVELAFTPEIGDHITIPDDNNQYKVIDRQVCIDTDGNVKYRLIVSEDTKVFTLSDLESADMNIVKVSANKNLIAKLLAAASADE